MFPNISPGVLTGWDVCAIVAYLAYLYLTRGTTQTLRARKRARQKTPSDDVVGPRAAKDPAPEEK